MKIVVLMLMLLISMDICAKPDRLKQIVKVTYNANVIKRDSGAPVTQEFLLNCVKQESLMVFKLECDDVVFPHFISVYKDSNSSMVLLITEFGASVENRFVYSAKSENLTKALWPAISNSTLSPLLIKQTGNEKYTVEYIRAIAHSSYRVIHLKSGKLDVISGLPDASYGIKLGEIQWINDRFVFKGI